MGITVLSKVLDLGSVIELDFPFVDQIMEILSSLLICTVNHFIVEEERIEGTLMKGKCLEERINISIEK